MRSTRQTALMIGMALATLAAATDAAAQILVMRSSGPVAQRMRAGTLLPAVRPIRLGPNDTLELLSDSSTWTWRGPGDFPTAVGATRAAPMIVAPDRRRARVGAVRGVPGSETSRPNLWMVDVGQPGAVCIPGEGPPLLWRADADAAATTTIAGPAGASGEVRWTEGQATTTWPETLPVAAGVYRLTNTGSETPVEIVIRPLDSAPETAPATGMALIQRGCDAQMELLAAQMEPRDELAGS